MRSKHLRYVLEYLAARIFICIIQAMRIETGAALARWLSWLLADVIGIRRKVVDENLAHAFVGLSQSERRRLIRRMWEHLLLLLLEIAHAPRKIHETNWRQYVSLQGQAELIRRMISDRPTLIVTGHFGNFEIGGVILGILGFPTYTVARTLDNPFLDGFINRFRGATGQHIIPKNGGYDQILDVLGSGGTMTFLADQYAGPKGCWVDFFGRPASVHKAIALLALEHNASLVVSSSLRMDRPLQIEMNAKHFIDPQDAGDELGTVPGLTQWYSHRLEEMIRRTPDQYWWLHRRWKDTRKARRKSKNKAA